LAMAESFASSVMSAVRRVKKSMKNESDVERIAKGMLLILCSVALIGAFFWWSQGNGEYGGRQHPIQLVFFGLAGIGYGIKIIFFRKH
jgi:hypothetical protein